VGQRLLPVLVLLSLRSQDLALASRRPKTRAACRTFREEPLREIARVHIARCEAGDMQAIKELANRLDGKPAQLLEHSGPDSEPIIKVVSEIVHVNLSPEELSALNEAEKLSAEPMPIERHRANGNGGLNEDTEGRLK
jgi:hypothetical protein